jgi:cytoskeletal protein CcmA (bactofilin family)
MPEIRIKDIDEHEIDTILAEDIDFEGQLAFKKPLMIKGKFKGEITSNSSLYVGEKAYVEAKVESGLVSSKGKIKGDIVGHTRVEFFSSSNIEGDVTTPDFVVESGCKFNGYCNMGGAARNVSQAAAQHAQSVGKPVPQSPDVVRPEQGVSQQPAPQQKQPTPPLGAGTTGGTPQGGPRQ